MRLMSDLIFKPQIFEALMDASDTNTQDYANLCNGILKEYIETLPKVYGFKDRDNKEGLRGIEWDADEFMHTHTARLIEIEELEEKK